jgi:hypothetical protein
VCSPALALAGAGATLGVWSTYNSSKADKTALEYQAGVESLNAQAAEWQANDALVRGVTAVREVRRKGESVQALQRAVFGGRGLSLTEGSPLAILDETAYFTEVDAATTRGNAEKDAWSARVRATGLRAQSQLSRYRADSINPTFNALAGALGGAGQVAGMWNKSRS